MSVRIQIVFYSMYGHIYKMAESVAEGVRAGGGTAMLMQVPELVPEEILVSSGARQARQVFAHIPTATVEGLREADAIIIGTPTRYGNMCAQMRNFLDQTGKLWMEGALVGKVGSAFTSTATQHGGQETTIVTTQITLMHLGMVIVGVPYAEQRLMQMDEISGGSPYGAGTLAGGTGQRQPSDIELAIARYQGTHVTKIAAKLAR